MGYDFHLGTGAPRLIEVNTNAGGAFLNAMLAKAQTSCCPEVEAAFTKPLADDFEGLVLRMFEREWTSQRRVGRPETIAIIDDRPTEQYLYPEFVIAQRLLQRSGFFTLIADPERLLYEGGRLTIDGRAIDLVYNRLVCQSASKWHPDRRAKRTPFSLMVHEAEARAARVKDIRPGGWRFGRDNYPERSDPRVLSRQLSLPVSTISQ